MIDIKTLKQLIKLMKDNDLCELDLRDAEEQVKLKRGPGGAVQYVPPPAPAPAPAAPTAPAPAESAPAKTPADEGLVEICSIMVGTFYSAASPDSEPYVQVGDKVNADTVVCLIESMKVFNEIKAETSGTIEKMLVENGQTVEFNTPLFLVRP